MRRIAFSFLAVGLLVLGRPGPAAAEVIASVVNVVETSGWLPPSPDAMGLTYDPSIGRLGVVDSEVEETSLFDGVNGWIAQTDGTVTGTFVTTDPDYVDNEAIPPNPLG